MGPGGVEGGDCCVPGGGALSKLENNMLLAPTCTAWVRGFTGAALCGTAMRTVQRERAGKGGQGRGWVPEEGRGGGTGSIKAVGWRL